MKAAAIITAIDNEVPEFVSDAESPCWGYGVQLGDQKFTIWVLNPRIGGHQFDGYGPEYDAVLRGDGRSAWETEAPHPDSYMDEIHEALMEDLDTLTDPMRPPF